MKFLEKLINNKNSEINKKLLNICDKVLNKIRISVDDCVELYQNGDLGLLGILANYVRESKNGLKTYYNRNIHIEPTNICIHNCRFCSYSKKIGGDGWEYTFEEIFEQISNADTAITEVHIVGGVHPYRDIYYYGNLLKQIRNKFPHLHIKAFTAVEIDYMIKKAGISIEEGVRFLKEQGLDSVPGGGAEIFDKKIRSQICSSKTSAEQWLAIHQALHLQGIPSNATILYGHIETYKHRANHLNLIRETQDKTFGFNAFIPLKFKNKNNTMSIINEVSVIEDLKNYAIIRIFLDNINHVKSYWPMVGKQLAQLSLSFGVDDFDGTINDSTKIYSLAGAEEANPCMTTDEIKKLINEAGRIPVERDSLYNEL